MNYGQFLNMIPEATLMAILIVVFIADFALKNNGKKHEVLYGLTGLLLFAQLVPCALAEPAAAFGGLYESSAAANVMKLILTAGTLIVVIMAQPWLLRDDVKNKEGEFYMLVISTLLGMYMMMSSGHFLMFFLGLEMASVPMACLVAFDKMRKQSAEGAAKYILTATFSSGVMLFGLSFIYAATGTLYFADVVTNLTASPLTIMGLVSILFSVILAVQTLVRYLTGTAVEGFTTVILLILIIGGFIMLSLGVIGHYIARIYEEVKGRPKYIISKITENVPESVMGSWKK